MRKFGGVAASPYNALRLLEQDELVAVFPEGVEGHRQGLLGPLPAAALRPRRLRGAGAAHRRADRAGGRRGQRGDLPEARRVAAARAAHRARRSSRSRRRSRWLGPLGAGAAAVEVADRVLRADRDRAATGRTRPRTARSCSSCPSGCARRSSTWSTRTWCGAAPRSCDPDRRKPAAPRESFPGSGAQGFLTIHHDRRTRKIPAEPLARKLRNRSATSADAHALPVVPVERRVVLLEGRLRHLADAHPAPRARRADRHEARVAAEAAAEARVADLEEAAGGAARPRDPPRPRPGRTRGA